MYKFAITTVYTMHTRYLHVTVRTHSVTCVVCLYPNWLILIIYI